MIEKGINDDSAIELSAQTIDACRNLLQANTDPALKALALTLPSASTIADNYETIPVEAINTQLKSLKTQLAVALENDFSQLLSACKSEKAYQLVGDEIAKRQLKQVCLSYLAELGDAATDKLTEQFDQADNLTDQLGAMQAGVWANHSAAESLLNKFEQQWRGEKLVMDKWFSTQALANNEATVERVKDLMTHPDFSLKNPNRVYSLLAAFTQNQAQFHKADGAGYELIGSVIQQLNTSNPQVASRLLSAFVSWRRYDENRQKLMRNQLESLRQLPNLASDLFEKIESCLTE
jgi:aminopeptidase N